MTMRSCHSGRLKTPDEGKKPDPGMSAVGLKCEVAKTKLQQCMSSAS